jgi:glycosyltransferase involved in cell wall biosynthesis
VKVLFIAPGDALHTARWIERVQGEGFECVFYDMTKRDVMQKLALNRIYRLEIGTTLTKYIRILETLGSVGSILIGLIQTLAHFVSLRTVFKNEKPDLVHIHWLYHPAAFAMTFFRRVTIISTPWGSDLLTPEYKRVFKTLNFVKHKFIVTRVVKKSTSYCCDAPHMKNELIKLGADTKKINLIYFGTDVEVFAPSKMDRSFWLKYGLDRDSIKVLSNRVLANMYDIETFIRACRIVQNSRGNVDFIVAGSGPQYDSLFEYAITNGPTKQITFTGRLNDNDFSVATASSDIYVSTSPTDGGIAASVAEAMSCEKPVVITNFGDNPEWLRNETAGYIFQAGDERQLASSIISLIDNPDLRRKMGVIGRNIIMEKNNSAIEVKKIVTLYNSLLHNETSNSKGFTNL